MDLVIIGAGGHGRVVLDALRLAKIDHPVGFIDADPARQGSTVGGLEVLGNIHLLPKLKRQGVAGAVVAIGDNRVRRSCAEMVLQNGLELVNAIHPAAVISPTATLGKDVFVAAGAIVGTDVAVEDDALVNTGAVVDHECRVGRAAHVCPGVLLAGRVRIGEGAFVGLGAKVIPCVTVGAWATVGAGAVVLEDVPEGATVVGVPARVIRKAAGRE